MSDDELNQEWRVITDPEAADALMRSAKRRYLEPFLQAELTLKEAATRLGVRPNTLLYQVRDLLRLGLLQVVRYERRPGRASPVYRASAQRFFVPFEHTSADTVEALAHATNPQLQARFERDVLRALQEQASQWGLSVYVMENGGVSVDVVPSAQFRVEDTAQILRKDYPPVWTSWTAVELNFEEAKQLQRDLVELWQRHLQHRVGRGTRYVLRLGLAPLDPQVDDATA